MASKKEAVETGPKEKTLALIMPEALRYEQDIRETIASRGFIVRRQTMIQFTKERALTFASYSGKEKKQMGKGQPQQRRSRVEDELGAEEDVEEGDDHSAGDDEFEDEGKDARGFHLSQMDDHKMTPVEQRAIILCSGTILALELEKYSGVKDFLKLLGPDTAKQWAKDPECLHAKYGNASDEARCGVRGSPDAQTATKELRLVFNAGEAGAPGSTAAGGAVGTGGRGERKEGGVGGGRGGGHQVSMEALLQFLFPPGLQHPESTGRLFVFGLYGPLDGDAQLRGGHGGAHVVSNRELSAMCGAIEREDVLQVYVEGRNLVPEEEEAILEQADERIKRQNNLTPTQVRHVLRKVPRTAEGCMSFHDMQKAIASFRAERLRRLKQMFPSTGMGPEGAPGPGGAAAAAAKRRQLREEASKTSSALLAVGAGPRPPVSTRVAPPTMFLRDKGVSDTQNAVVTSKLLTKSSFAICSVENGNDPALTQNVRLIRDPYLPSETQARWDNMCCIRGTQRGSFVDEKEKGGRMMRK